MSTSRTQKTTEVVGKKNNRKLPVLLYKNPHTEKKKIMMEVEKKVGDGKTATKKKKKSRLIHGLK